MGLIKPEFIFWETDLKQNVNFYKSAFFYLFTFFFSCQPSPALIKSPLELQFTHVISYLKT